MARTLSLVLGDDYENVGALMDALSDFTGESRVWTDVKVKAVGGTVRVAAMGGTAAPTTDDASIGVESDETREFDRLDLTKTWVRSTGVFGSEADSEEGSDEAGTLEIIGTPE